MVSSSLSILSPTPSFPSGSNTDSSCTSTSARVRSFKASNRNFRLLKPVRLYNSLPSLNFGASSKQATDDVSAGQFTQNNSISDFMRFRRGADAGNGELQTAVVSYRKKFPWSLLRPFLQV